MSRSNSVPVHAWHAAGDAGDGVAGDGVAGDGSGAGGHADALLVAVIQRVGGV